MAPQKRVPEQGGNYPLESHRGSISDGLADDWEDLFLQLFHVLEVHVILKIGQVFLQFIDHFLLIVRRFSHHGVVHGAVAAALQHHHSTVCQFGLSVLFL